MILPVAIFALLAAQDMEVSSSAPPPDLVARKLQFNLSDIPKLDQTQIQLARDIGRDVCCLCGGCPKEPMTDCRCGWAGANRTTIQIAVLRGIPREQIIEAYRAAYGEKILAMVPKDGAAQSAWIVPYAAGGIMLMMVLFVGIRGLRRTKQRQDLPPETEGRQDARGELAKELRELD